VEPPPVVEERDGLSPVWWKTFANVAGALAIGGAITGGLVLWKESQFEERVDECRRGRPAACQDGLDVASDGEALGTTTTVLFVVAGAAAATAVTMLFFTDFGDDEAEPTEPPAPAVGVGFGPTADPLTGALTGGLVEASFRF
jgi:hypothetical protein